MIAVVDYHKGNLKSVERGLIGVGADARITDDVKQILSAEAVVLPGVGAFTDAAESMRALDQMQVVKDCIQKGVPFLGICLGMHLLFEGGAEHAVGQPTPGMGFLPGVVDRLPAKDEQGQAYKIPHVGWNTVDLAFEDDENPEAAALFEGLPSGEFFYFTHSFAVPDSKATIATTTHSVQFPCAVQLGPKAFGVQFHPEKSSDAGARLLENFVSLATR